MKLVDKEPRVDIMQSHKHYGWVKFISIPKSQAQAKLEKLKVIFPNHNWMIKE